MERFKPSWLSDRQFSGLNLLFKKLESEAKNASHVLRKDAEDLKRFIHMCRAVGFITSNERNYYLDQIDEITGEKKHDDTLVGCVRQSLAEVNDD